MFVAHDEMQSGQLRQFEGRRSVGNAREERRSIRQTGYMMI